MIPEPQVEQQAVSSVPVKVRLSLPRQALFWSAGFLVLVLILWLLSNILLPFVAGFALAYFLDPLADRLQRTGLSRTLSALVILLTFVLLAVVGIAVLAPLLVNQFNSFLENLPNIISRIQALIAGPGLGWLREITGGMVPDVQASVDAMVGQGAGWFGGVLKGLWSTTGTLMSIASLFVVTPVVAFYMLVDWDRMVREVDSLIPVYHRETARGLASEMDDAIAGFVRGQGAVCLILGGFYAISLSLAGLNFGLLIGLISGIIGFIPYVGSATGFVLAGGVALVQFWPDYLWIGLVIGIFILGQFVEGNILQPNLVGRSVGLHPVWLMFALVAFGSLFGFAGLLLAVPLAAAIGVLTRFATRQYRESPIYSGRPSESDLII
ncbi:AI-2E family transporter [Terrihabitans rhizophilus]|jgi:predicted PurR-regulated permease PerM|uniref:AI-2E family transporter n=1 Tax=Terrihabitans rhizophilus TaxID=3092662 RepID=A0ABU4RNP7_9HYPH|nr:AI-2E family transporter [Terrihabitans sp. PJ23]MDX6805275.1 AI-2E family transporter [Terrihabitans sp. PJ23]